MYKVDTLPGFSCKRCARCCIGKTVAVYDMDIVRLKEMKIEDFCDKMSELENLATGAQNKMKMLMGKCVFLDGKSCKHYNKRPNTCRRHPFIVTDKVLLVSTTCPGIDWSTNSEKKDYNEVSRDIAERIDAFLELIEADS